MNVNELIQVQTGQISSRLLWEGCVSDAFVFAMDSGESISPERAELSRWFCVLEGELRLVSATSEEMLGPGDTRMIAAGLEHELRCSIPCKFIQISVV
ncbi:hypothetical protein PA598K_00524 [Paenibacillus sp. 598K]|uniref:hypothetical protein n=1 Tax=Paenibacillus sp. 598K TaxID=1117987 RepID=UPI000FF946D8|nr:hypothetical protein [Paenibacillus sp. 598K]GBF72284.1 hypothetical protein PA598K_00524 [Paenibacillus sp. 598K]